MKKITAMIAVLAILCCFLSACGQPTYEDGYEEGHADGYLEGYDEGYDEGYEEGYDHGYDYAQYDISIDDILAEAEHEASKYASREGNWHPEEAWGVIEAYHNHEPFYENGSPPSYQDYLDAINSMIYFYEYFYGGHYE